MNHHRFQPIQHTFKEFVHLKKNTFCKGTLYLSQTFKINTSGDTLISVVIKAVNLFKKVPFNCQTNKVQYLRLSVHKMEVPQAFFRADTLTISHDSLQLHSSS